MIEDITNENKHKNEVEFNQLYNHIKNLNIPTVEENDHMTSIIDKVKGMEPIQNFTQLDSIIKEAEISKAISQLKIGKAVGFDLIRNEILKSSILLKPLSKIFNLVQSTRHYPAGARDVSSPCTRNVTPVIPPSNYRGIKITSAPWKIIQLHPKCKAL